jgi:hypothetical protein
MDVLNSLFIKAGDDGLLQPAANRSANQRVLLNADDVALFIRPVELQITKVLDCFSNVSGLQTNFPKSCAFPM